MLESAYETRQCEPVVKLKNWRITVKPVGVQLIPLSSAYLCQDCSCVGNCAERCPACASCALMGLASVLDREQEKKPKSRARAAYPFWRQQLQPAA